MKQLVVTADDFGAAREVNEAIEAAHRNGILTAASLMMGAPEADDAVARARRLPKLAVGLHLVLVEGRPVLPPRRVPDLVDARGFFRSDMAAAGANIFFNPRARVQLVSEIVAQFEAFQNTGLALDHVNAHKHFHLHPTIGRLVAEIGARFGLRAARVPNEPAEVLRRIEPEAPPSGAWLIAPWAHLLRRRLGAQGILAPDNVFGLHWSGAMTQSRLCGILRNLPDGLSEIYCHPATRGGFEGAAPGYRYADELAALLSPDAIGAARDPSLRLGSFADFVPATQIGAVPKPAAQEAQELT